MWKELENIKEKYEQLTKFLYDPANSSNTKELGKVSKERADLEPIFLAFRSYLKIQKDISESKEILADPENDEDLKELAENELAQLEELEKKLYQELKALLIPKDPYDEKNVILEIRAGAGGDEASLFAQDLFRMYSRYAEKKGWKIEIMSSSSSPIKGIKEIIGNIRGEKVYSHLKFESGVHRVQRVPQTEASGRIHTSTSTVAVLPEAEEVDIHLASKDLRIEAFGASGPGGQSVNRTYSAIRITHIPTGIAVSCQDEKSQHRNKEKALRILRSRILDIAQREQQQLIAKDRKLQVGTGERSEKIRTYNYSQSRVTDHRLNLTLHRLENILDGELDEIIEALTLKIQSDQISNLAEATS
ncbi:MAG: peptide chain release factor 1 [Candidatus Aminicenantes bacterium]|nr:peptide chain release factor 1 [Candidatus Aminicenantes bacterium]